MTTNIFQKLLVTEEEFGKLSEELAAAYPDLIRLGEIGKSQGGRPIRLFTVTEFSSGEEKPGFFIQGHIHSKEMSGTLAGLDIIRRLAEDYTPGGILSKAVFYVIPRCNPDGAERMAQLPGDERSSWGDYTDEINTIERCDLDGDGLSRSILYEHPDGEMVRLESDPRCLVGRKPDSKGPFYMIFSEGLFRNFDRDKLKNWPSFARKYIDWNRNWPVGWSPDQFGNGDAPLSVPEVRLQADWLKAHPNICGAIALHNGYGCQMFPPTFEEDQAYVKDLGARAEKFTGHPSLYGKVHGLANSGPIARGVFDDYCYGELGYLCVVVELGTRENSAGGNSLELFDRPDAYTAPYEILAQQDADPSLPTCVWDWEEFEHPQLGKVLIGGSCPTLFASPLLDYLEKVTEGVYHFVLDFLNDSLQGKGVRRAIRK